MWPSLSVPRTSRAAAVSSGSVVAAPRRAAVSSSAASWQGWGSPIVGVALSALNTPRPAEWYLSVCMHLHGNGSEKVVFEPSILDFALRKGQLAPALRR
jgi:hypothetical protein